MAMNIGKTGQIYPIGPNIIRRQLMRKELVSLGIPEPPDELFQVPAVVLLGILGKAFFNFAIIKEIGNMAYYGFVGFNHWNNAKRKFRPQFASIRIKRGNNCYR